MKLRPLWQVQDAWPAQGPSATPYTGDPAAACMGQACYDSARQAAYSAIAVTLQNLQSVAANLEDPTVLLAPQAQSSNPAIITGQASLQATSTTYSVVVQSLAAAQSNLSADFVSPTQAGLLANGSLSITANSQNSVTFNIDDTTTLSGLAQNINTAGFGVVASVFGDGQGYRLQLTSQQTGAGRAYQVADANTGLDLEDNVVQAASDATLVVNGSLTLTSPTNIFRQALVGLTLEAVATSTSPQTIAVGPSCAGVTAGLQALVAAYNSVQSAFATATSSNMGQPNRLGNDATLLTLVGQLQGAIGGGASGTSGPLVALSMVGITTQPDNTLALNTATLSAAAATNLQGVAELLAANAGALSAIASTFGDPASGILPTLSRQMTTQHFDDGLLGHLDGVTSLRYAQLQEQLF